MAPDSCSNPDETAGKVFYNHRMSFGFYKWRQCFLGWFVSVMLVSLMVTSVTANQQDLTTDALKILKSKCGNCHSADNQKAELDLSSVEAILQGGESGAIVAKNYEESLLWEMISNELMPPEEEPQLTAEERGLLKRWLEQSSFSATQPKAISQWNVLPILQLRCVICHGKTVAEAGLDLRSHASILKGGKSGPAIVAGRPAESLLLRRIHAGEMPPKRRIVEASIKVITETEVQLLEKWIAAGAPNDAAVIDAPGNGPDPLVTDEERNFWAFQTPKKSSLPEVKNRTWSQNPIDQLILEGIERAGLTPAPAASKAVLLRRVYFDLLGIPPTSAQLQEFLDDESPAAYERLIERVLASPYYGERWGGLWLDLAGYSDSEGIQESDPVRPSNYLYRDYVIRSFNSDKPYSRFIKEQLAGDDLADYTDPAHISSEVMDNLIATGFLRQSSDGTFSNITGFVPDRNRYIGSSIEVYTSAILGLTLKCAKCHSHKFDPIPQRDYYRLLAVFKGALDENAWMSPLQDRGVTALKPMRLLSVVETAERESIEAHNTRITQAVAELTRQRSELELATITQLQEAEFKKLPQEIREDVRTALNAAKEKRTKVQVYLVEKFEKQIRFDVGRAEDVDAEFKKQRAQQTAAIEAKKKERRAITPIRALWDRGDPSPTYILTRGDYQTPGRRVGPGVPSVLTDGESAFVAKRPFENSPSTGRRLALAEWTTDKSHPLTARVMVNRIWKSHFQHGIVKTLDNFGVNGTKPTHPELLDWLAVEFMESGWSIKHIHRLILTSATYRQSSLITEQHELRDPENKWLSRMPMRRMDAEMLRDSLISLAGVRRDHQFGPADPVASRADGLVTSSPINNTWRRSVYVLHRRTQMPTLLTSFDRPRMSPNCVERTESTVAPQALHLMNNQQVKIWATQFADQIMSIHPDDPEAQVRLVYTQALSRQPGEDELRLTLETMHRMAEIFKAESPESDVNRSVIRNVCHALLNSAAFIYVD